MWRQICHVETNLSCEEISPRERCGDKSDLSQFMLFCRKICFVAIYAVLSRNLFGRDLRALVWRKIEPTILSVEKKGQIWGMLIPPHCGPGARYINLQKNRQNEATALWTLLSPILKCFSTLVPKQWIFGNFCIFGLVKGDFQLLGPKNGPPIGQTATYWEPEWIQS